MGIRKSWRLTGLNTRRRGKRSTWVEMFAAAQKIPVTGGRWKKFLQKPRFGTWLDMVV